MGVGRFPGGGDVQQNSKRIKNESLKGQRNPLGQRPGRECPGPVPLCFSEVVRKRQRGEGEADDDEEGVSGRITTGTPGSNRGPLKVIGRGG